MAKVKHPPPKLNRKQLRKLHRLEKKKRRHQGSNFTSDQPTLEVNPSPKRSKAKEIVKPKKEPSQNSEKPMFQKLQRSMNTERIKRLKEDNAKEDRIIRSLEKKLKMNVNKKGLLSKSFVNEGLDYLLEVCDFENHKGSMNLESELNYAQLYDTQMRSEFDEDLSTVTHTALNDARETESKDVVTEDLTDEKNLEIFKKKRRKRSQNNVNNVESKSEVENIEQLGSNMVLEDDSLITLRNTFRNLRNKLNRARNRHHSSEIIDELSNNLKTAKSLYHAALRRLKCERESVDQRDNEVLEDEDIRESDTEDDVENVLQEDIYGRLRREDGTVVENQTKYVPPCLRNVADSSDTNSEKLARLKKQMKGLLNRLTGKNMHSISSEIEQIYGNNSRHDVNSTLIQLLKESIISHTFSPIRIIIEQALLVSILHANVGLEVGSYVLEKYVKEYDMLMKESMLPIEDKRIDNIIATLVQLYNFKVFNACLIYEILDQLIERFQEKDIDLVLLIFKNVGFNLRKDDPSKLKEVILRIQNKTYSSSEHTENSRAKFMLETLLAIKNNNKLKVLQLEADYIESLRKLSKTMLNNGKYVSELKITMEDLLNVGSRGRWWIVGSAWQGSTSINEKTNLKTNSSMNFDDKLLSLARQQHMNTEVRKNIFCILMSAEDYMDAFEKLLKLGLKGKQCQEVIYVTMHCLLQEKTYNPYYSFVAEQFSSLDRKYLLAIQFSSWDKFKEIESLKNEQISNLAQFLAYLIQNKKLSLSVLKVLQFTEMNKPMVRLIRQLLLSILLPNEETAIAEIFASVSKSDALFALRAGLQLFLHHFILREAANKNCNENDAHLETLPKKVEIAENAMGGAGS